MNPTLEDIYENTLYKPTYTNEQLMLQKQTNKIINDYHTLLRSLIVFSQLLKDNNFDNRVIELLAKNEAKLKDSEKEFYDHFKYIIE